MGAFRGRVALATSLVALGGIAMGGSARAQQVPTPVGGKLPPQDQGSVPSRAEVELQKPPAPAPSTARVEASGALAAAPCALEDSPVQVTLSAITFETPEGTPIAPELQVLLADAAMVPAGEQPISVVCRVRDRVNELLSGAGYIALAQIPPQEIRSGQFRLQIVTAKIVEIRVLGELGSFRKEIERRIDALRALSPLNRRDAERILLLTGDVPGVDVTLSLSPAQTRPGEVIGTLTVETRRLQVLGNIQNFGSPQLGPWVASLRAEAYGLTGLADRTYFSYSNSIDWDEIRVAQAGHDFALNDNGLRVQTAGSVAFSRPDIRDLDLRSRSAILSVELNQQLVRTVPAQLRLGAGLELLNQRTRIHQSGAKVPFTRDSLRVAYLRTNGQVNLYDSDGSSALLTGYAEVRKGTGLFGASEQGEVSNGYSPSRFDGNPRATVIRGEMIADFRTRKLVSLGISAFGQWANDPLLNLEEFSLGNYTYGRGYDPGSNGADRAVAFRIEPRVRLPLALPVSVEATGFYDWVRLYNLDAGSTERNRLLRSVGGGLRFIMPGVLALDAFYAKPLDPALSTDTFADGRVRKPNGRFMVSLTTQFFPWGGR